MDERRFDWDERKAETNHVRHKIGFEAVRAFDFEAAVIVEDRRHDYGEIRLEATGPIGERLHVLVYTMRGPAVRVISLRKANKREAKAYVRQLQNER